MAKIMTISVAIFIENIYFLPGRGYTKKISRNQKSLARLPAKIGENILQMSLTIYGDFFHDPTSFSNVPLLYYG
jgi:hypothetical protein